MSRAVVPMRHALSLTSEPANVELSACLDGEGTFLWVGYSAGDRNGDARERCIATTEPGKVDALYEMAKAIIETVETARQRPRRRKAS
ncbi:MAG: hypothetical protein Q8L86_03095 [Vicinamibacterales bacterium]|nr:hypothetical protein [Vicinamibacterales bacterium]